MTVDDSFVVTFMERVLQAVVDEYTAAGVSLPDRRYVTFATPAADCAQLTVALQQLYLGSPGLPATEPTPCDTTTTAVLRVELLRPVPIPTDRQLTVPVTDLAAAGKAQIYDGEIMLQSVTRMCGRDWGALGVFADVVMGLEQGGYAGPVMTLTAGVP